MPSHFTAIEVLRSLGHPPSCRGSAPSDAPCLVLSLFDQARPHSVLPAGQELARAAFGQPVLEGKDGIAMTPPVQQLEGVAVRRRACLTNLKLNFNFILRTPTTPSPLSPPTTPEFRLPQLRGDPSDSARSYDSGGRHGEAGRKH